MAERLAVATARAGIDDAGTARILAAYTTAMRARDHLLEDEADIDYLHPARTALILIEDLGVRDPRLIAAGALVESEHPELRVRAEDLVDDEVAQTIAAVPTPIGAGDRLLEELLIADAEVRVIALAEWLDQVRRLHLRDPGSWETRHRLACQVYLPIAERTDPTLARRFRWWCRTFEERYLQRVTGDGG